MARKTSNVALLNIIDTKKKNFYFIIITFAAICMMLLGLPDILR